MSELNPPIPESATEPELFRYQSLLIRLGLLAGEPGSYTVSEHARPLITALHRVLAGGEVRVEVVHPGLEPIHERLECAFEQFIDEFNDSLERDEPRLLLP